MLVVALMLVLPVAVPGVDGAYRQIETRTEEVTGSTVVMIAPAVGELPDGTLQGVGMQMEATVRDGSGGVYVETRPLTQIDMQGSARLAATMATAISGEEMRDHDFFVTMRSPAPAVGGPSAGAAMTVAFTALLLDLPVRDDVVMTGMINPDGSIGAVGGILEKAEAAHENGAELFLIPEGQGIVRRTVREVSDEGGWFPTVGVREEQVDVVQYAEEQWGLTVREMSDVYEAIEATTDHRIERPEPPETPGPPLFQDVMEAAATEQVETADARLADLRGRIAESPAPARIAEQLGALLDQAEEALDRAHAAIDSGAAYTASSRAFQATVALGTVDLWLQTIEAPDDRAFLQARGERAADQLDEARDNSSEMSPDTVSSLEAVGAAQVRALEAARLIDQAESALADDRLPETVEALAFGMARIASVEWWLGLAADLSEKEQAAGLQADPRDLASDYLSIAQQAVIYAQVLLSQTGTDPATGRLLQESVRSLEDAQRARQQGLHVGALYLAMEAQVAGHAALSLVGAASDPAVLEDRLARQRDRAFIQIAATRDHGAEPFLAVSYAEFAGSLSEDQPLDALIMYGNAATIAATSGALATGDVCGFGPASCDVQRPFLQRVAVPGPDPWTAYLALATVLLGFMAGVLVTLVVLQAKERRDVGHPARGPTTGPAASAGAMAAAARPHPARPAPRRRPTASIAGHPMPRPVVPRGIPGRAVYEGRARASLPPATNHK